MRDILEDAQAHRDDGVGRADKRDKPDLPKRFYEQTGVAPVDGGYTVTLDGRPTRTPGKVPVVVPTVALAQAMAAEWAGQKERIDPGIMPTVRLVNSALEQGEGTCAKLRTEIGRYAAGDLLYYRADTPRELVVEQDRVWDPMLATLASRFGVAFRPTVGIVHQEQPKQTLAKLAEVMGDVELLPLAALVSVTGLTGSGLLAIGLWHELFVADQVWTAAHVDEDFNARIWGRDAEAEALRKRRRAEFDAAVNVVTILGDTS